MVTGDEVRRIALALPEAVEQDHHGRPSFRVGGKIFATLWDDRHLNVMLDEPGILTAVQTRPGVCAERWWGKRLAAVVIEAGFPIASPGDFEAVKAIAREVEGPVICGLARTSKQDIDAAWSAVKDAERPRIHTFIATSDIHIERKLQTTRDDVKGQARAAVAHAKQYADDVEFSPEDGSRSDIEFMAEVIQIAIDEGATTINVPDTVGYTMPDEYAAMFEELYRLLPPPRKG